MPNKRDFTITSVLRLPDGRDEVRVEPVDHSPTDHPTVWRVMPPHDLVAGDPCTIEDYVMRERK